MSPLDAPRRRMGRREFLRLGAILGAAAAAMPLSAIADEGIALGAYVAGAPWDAAKLDQYAGLVGKMPALVQWMQPWSSQYPNHTQFRADFMDAVVDRGAKPLVMWGPSTWEFHNKNQPDFRLKTIYEGKHDAYIRQWARDARAWGKPFFLRYAWEMNGYWFAWSPNVNGNGSGDEYKRAWRHVYNLFQQEGATNARFVWSANVDNEPEVLPFSAVYPGDEYVHWVALDAYNKGRQNTGVNWWKSLRESFGGPYDRLTRLTKKPIMFAETASVEAGGDKAGWIRQGFLEDMTARFPRVKIVNWWHQGASDYDWRSDTSAASKEAYREVATSTLYARRLLA